MKRKIVTIVGCIIILILIIVCMLTILFEDNEAPAIKFDDTEIIYHAGDDMETLLCYATALDKVDGDVTDSMMIESVSVLSSEEAKVVFVAKDKKNNISKVGKIVVYNQ